MMFDMDTLLLDPTYAAWAIDAVFTDKDGAQHPLRMLDKRDGSNLTAARGYSGSTTMLPRGIDIEAALVLVRNSECPRKPTGWKVTLPSDDGETTYVVAKSQLKAREWWCTLQEA